MFCFRSTAAILSAERKLVSPTLLILDGIVSRPATSAGANRADGMSTTGGGVRGAGEISATGGEVRGAGEISATG